LVYGVFKERKTAASDEKRKVKNRGRELHMTKGVGLVLSADGNLWWWVKSKGVPDSRVAASKA